MNEYIARMKAYAENEENALCRAMIEDNLAEIGALAPARPSTIGSS
jgi:hypothetical protein